MHGGGHWPGRAQDHSFQRLAARIGKVPGGFSGMEIRHESGKSSYSAHPRDRQTRPEECVNLNDCGAPSSVGRANALLRRQSKSNHLCIQSFS